MTTGKRVQGSPEDGFWTKSTCNHRSCMSDIKGQNRLLLRSHLLWQTFSGLSETFIPPCPSSLLPCFVIIILITIFLFIKHPSIYCLVPVIMWNPQGWELCWIHKTYDGTSHMLDPQSFFSPGSDESCCCFFQVLRLVTWQAWFPGSLRWKYYEMESKAPGKAQEPEWWREEAILRADPPMAGHCGS